jgi:hypothetical protein
VLGVDDVMLFSSNSSSRKGGVSSSMLSHRSSGSDSNSEFWDAVEMLDDAVRKDNHTHTERE